MAGFRFRELDMQKIFKHYMFSTQITMELFHCDNINLLMIKKQQTNLPWFTSLYHIITINVTLNANVPVAYDDTMSFDQRFIFLKFAIQTEKNVQFT